MADDFLATAKTMFVDAETLHRNLAYRNACYLYGYVTECFLKKVLEAAGISLKKTHDLTYLGELVEAVRVAATSQVSHHLAPPISSLMTKDKHWHPYHRYDGSRWDKTTCSNTKVRQKRTTASSWNCSSTESLNEHTIWRVLEEMP